MDSEMSDGTPVSSHLDAGMLADLRAWRARNQTGLRYVTLAIYELDMFLRVAEERDKLRRELHDMPDDATLPPAPVRSVTFTADIPADARERAGIAPSERGLLPFCDCGSVDKNGDDLGEHGDECPYHLAVVNLSRWIAQADLDALCKRTLAAQARLA